MCILFVYADPTPPEGGYRLIVASNRDEFYKRPAQNAFKCPENNIIGGRDLEPGREGGMWLGASMKPSLIKFAAILNVTGEEKRPATSGRGPLVYNYLKSDESASQYIHDLEANTYSAFNLFLMEVTADSCSAYHHSNSPEATFEYHGKQVLAFGNSTPNTPFTKVRNGKKTFEDIVRKVSTRDELVQELLALLKSEQSHLPDAELERRAPEAASFLSAVYVRMKSGGYGTRTHSLVLVDDDCNVEFVEHTMRGSDYDSPQWDVTTIKTKL